jgi:Arc/MetJ-type ribon-helix-helix transcriptional regulator
MMEKFDFHAPAELFPSRNRKVVNKVKYRRFEKAAEAIRFAVEELPDAQLLGAYIQIDEQRLGHQEIRKLYASEHYPLKKKRVEEAA